MQLLHILLLIALLWLVVLNIDEEEFEKRNIERLPIALLWRTERGLEGVDYFAKKARRFWGLLSDLGILISIPLMAFVLYELTMSARHILVAPEAPPGIAPALPGLRIPGSPIYIPFWYGIFALMTVLVAHEIMHGIITKAEGLRLKSLGILFVTLVPLGAFAEPDEDELERSSKRTKLRVYAAGSFGNFLLVILSIFLISTIIAPGMFQEDYVNISRVFPNTPAEVYGLRENTTLISINGVRVNTMEEFYSIARRIKPGDEVMIETNRGVVSLIATTRPEENAIIRLIRLIFGRGDLEDRGYIGIGIASHLSVKPTASSLLGERIPWVIVKEFEWILILNLFIGLTNLLPVYPLDGGRIFEEIAKVISPKGARHITSLVFAFVILLLFINFSPFLKIIL